MWHNTYSEAIWGPRPTQPSITDAAMELKRATIKPRLIVYATKKEITFEARTPQGLLCGLHHWEWKD